MNIAHNLDRRTQLQQRGLRKKDFANGGADGRDLGIFQANSLGDLGRISGVEQSRDHVVQIHIVDISNAHSSPGGGTRQFSELGTEGSLCLGSARVDLILTLDQDGTACLLGGRMMVGLMGRLVRDCSDLAGALCAVDRPMSFAHGLGLSGRGWTGRGVCAGGWCIVIVSG